MTGVHQLRNCKNVWGECATAHFEFAAVFAYMACLGLLEGDLGSMSNMPSSGHTDWQVSYEMYRNTTAKYLFKIAKIVL